MIRKCWFQLVFLWIKLSGQGGWKVNLRLGFLLFLLRNLCWFVHFGVHHPILQTMLHAEFLLSLLWPKPTQMYIYEHWCFLLLTSRSHVLYIKNESGEALLKFCQLVLWKCFREWNQTPYISNITINYVDPATSTETGNFAKNANLNSFSFLAFTKYSEINGFNILFWSRAGDTLNMRFHFCAIILSYHNHLHNRLPVGKKIAQYFIRRHLHMGIWNIRENLFYIFDNMN